MYKILARSLTVLRSANVMPRLVHRDLETEAKERGDTIDIPVPPTVGTSAVAPSNVPPNPADQTPTKIQLSLDNWRKSDPFKLSDKDRKEIIANDHFIPDNLAAGVAALADYVNGEIFSVYKGVYGWHGTAGTTPFGNEKLTDSSQTRKVLNTQKAPLSNRRLVLDPEADAAADLVTSFTLEKSGSNQVVMEGLKGRKGGFDWYMDQQIPTHTAGSLTGTITASATAIGLKVVELNSGSGEAVALLEGDIVTFAGHTQTYVVTADLTVGASATGNLNIEPGLAVALAGTEAISVKGDHTVNLGFHRDAIAFAARGFEDREGTAQLADPHSGLLLRLERIFQYKQEMWELDILFGKKLIRAELATRLAG